MEIDRIEGLAIHYYLEHIQYNSQEERDYARKMVLARYGNILGPVKTDEIFERVESFIKNNPGYFEDRWKVFTEYEIKDGNQVYRIDRLLVDEGGKEIKIIDYKSGETREKTQLEKYKDLLEEKTGGEYSISVEFVEV